MLNRKDRKVYWNSNWEGQTEVLSSFGYFWGFFHGSLSGYQTSKAAQTSAGARADSRFIPKLQLFRKSPNIFTIAHHLVVLYCNLFSPENERTSRLCTAVQYSYCTYQKVMPIGGGYAQPFKMGSILYHEPISTRIAIILRLCLLLGDTIIVTSGWRCEQALSSFWSRDCLLAGWIPAVRITKIHSFCFSEQD